MFWYGDSAINLKLLMIHIYIIFKITLNSKLAVLINITPQALLWLFSVHHYCYVDKIKLIKI